MSIVDARRREIDYFNSLKDYQGLRNIGTDYLSKDLSEKLVMSVRRQLPNISGFLQKRCGGGCRLGLGGGEGRGGEGGNTEWGSGWGEGLGWGRGSCAG
jgi:hypothetical protein